MKQAVLKRLGLLEERHAAAVNARRSPCDREKAFAWFNNILRAFNEEPVPSPRESMMDKLARCLGMKSYELRALLLNPNEFQRVLKMELERAIRSRATA